MLPLDPNFEKWPSEKRCDKLFEGVESHFRGTAGAKWSSAMTRTTINSKKGTASPSGKNVKLT
jgi:hypothetical protein